MNGEKDFLGSIVEQNEIQPNHRSRPLNTFVILRLAFFAGRRTYGPVGSGNAAGECTGPSPRKKRGAQDDIGNGDLGEWRLEEDYFAARSRAICRANSGFDGKSCCNPVSNWIAFGLSFSRTYAIASRIRAKGAR